MFKTILILAETSKRDRELIIVSPSTFSTDTTTLASPMLKSVIVRAPSGGTPSASVSYYTFNKQTS